MKTASHFAKERQPDDVTEHEMGHLPTLARLSCARVLQQHREIMQLALSREDDGISGCFRGEKGRRVSVRWRKGGRGAQCRKESGKYGAAALSRWNFIVTASSNRNSCTRAVYGAVLSRKYASPMTSRSKCTWRMLDAVVKFLNSDTVYGRDRDEGG